MKKEQKDKVIRVLKDLKRARRVKKSWIEEAKEDFEFLYGKQWDSEKKEKLEKSGKPALTINKIQPNIHLVSGIQRQNKTDFKAYPEGSEDSLAADITTRLLKNAIKRSMCEYKLNEQFEDGITCGEGWIEPYIDYTTDLINGQLRIKKESPFEIYIDPDSTEYDLSDAEFVVKVKQGLSKEQLNKLFPDKEKEINRIGNGTINLDEIGKGGHRQVTDYPDADQMDGEDEFEEKDKGYDLIEYQYKKYVARYVIADKTQGKTVETSNKEEAEAYQEQWDKGGEVKIFKRMTPEIWICSLVGNTLVDDYLAPFYPRWKSFSLFAFLAHRTTVPMKDREYMVQGIVRGLKDPQREMNKRRSQELHHLNSSTNSGWLAEEDSIKKKEDAKKYGAASGYILEYKKNAARPERIFPAPLSQGHAQLAAEATQDMKEISGINADLLAQNESTQSGKAIHLRQQQGMVMIQRIMDNFSFTKKLIGKFILSQLGELYTIESAVRVVGEAFIKESFSRPVLDPMTNEPQLDETGELVTEVDEEGVMAVFNQVLNDPDLVNYDISVGEGANSQTVKYGNSLLLMELLEKGFPIPPDIIIDETLMDTGVKERIKQSLAQAEAKAEVKATAQP